MSLSIDVPVVVITGASSGIGKALAEKYSRSRLCRLVLASRDRVLLKSVAEKCQKLGTEVAIFPTDVSVEKQCRNLVKETLRVFGQIDKLILNAGVSMHIPFEEVTDLGMFRRLMDINYFGCVYCTKYALPHLRASKSPHIVVVGSLSGETGVPLRTGYCASKYAVNGFFDALRIELGDDIPITVVSPNYVDTNIRKSSFGPRDFRPVRSMMTAETCADLIMDAVDSKKRKVVLTVSGKLAVALKPFLPQLVDAIVKRKAYGQPGGKRALAGETGAPERHGAAVKSAL